MSRLERLAASLGDGLDSLCGVLERASGSVAEVAAGLNSLADAQGEDRGDSAGPELGDPELGAQVVAGALICARALHRARGDGGFGIAQVTNHLPYLEPAIAQLCDFVLSEAGAGPLLDALSLQSLAVDDIAPLHESLLARRQRIQRRRHGVYHTPTEVATHLIERVDRALVELGFSRGLHDARSYEAMSMAAPPGVASDAPVLRIVEPAAGVGVLLRELLRHASRTAFAGAPKRFEAYVAGCLWSRLSGYELMPVTSALCRMHLSVALSELGCSPTLAGTLDLRTENFLQVVVGDPARLRGTAVIIGNPPYARGSQNRSSPIQQLIAPYKLGLTDERNLQPLSDDYIKFVRATEVVMRGVPVGVLGLVTNHTFLRGRLHRTMRRSLRETFARIDVLDLHGNAKVRPRGRRDENVFPISQGVAVSTLVRSPEGRPAAGTEAPRVAAVRHAELRGSRGDKLDRLRTGSLPPFLRLTGQPLDAFAPVERVPEEYGEFVPLPELFEYHSVGGKPGDDNMLVGFERQELLDKLEQRSDELLKGQHPRTEAARKLARRPSDKPFAPESVIPYAYRPFDDRLAYYEPEIWTRPLRSLRQHVDGSPILLTTRIVKDSRFAHVFTTRCFPDVIALSTTSSVNCYAFPSTRLDAQRISHGSGLVLSQAEAFAYVYAALHSPIYRERYVGALRTDFPRVPIGRHPGLVAALVARGGKLLRAHLGEGTPAGRRPRFVDGGDRVVRATKVETGDMTHVAVNAVSSFTDLPVDCWDFHVGGYQVCRKWLVDRKRAQRELTNSDIDHYCDMIARIDQTLQLQRDIDQIVASHGGWPGAFA